MTAVKLPETETRVKSITVTATIFSDRAHGLVVRTVVILADDTKLMSEHADAMPLRAKAHFWDYLAEDTMDDIEEHLGLVPWEEVPWRGEFVRTFKETVREALKGVGIE